MRHLLTLLAALAIALPAPAAERPNVVVVLADDLGWGDPRCYNPASKIPTPHIDALAAAGTRFTDAHSPSAVCTPTRYGLMTGRYAWRTSLKRGVLNGYSPALIEPGRTTLASLLKKHGYATACVGKWHLGLGDAAKTDYDKPLRPGPLTAGFDEFFGIAASLDMPPYAFLDGDRPAGPITEQIAASAMRRNGGEGFWRAGAIAPGFRHVDVLPRLTERAEGFLRKQTPGKPFFLYLPLTGPHTPWMPTPEFRGRSGADWYGDFAAQVDATFGRVLKALDDAKLAQDTLVVFASDNGAHWLPADIAKHGHRANADWRGQKADVYEAGHRVPLVVRWPGRVPAGAVRGELACLTDVFATVAEIVGEALPPDAGEDSVSQLAVWRGARVNGPPRTSAVLHSGDGTFVMRAGPWVLVPALGSHGFTVPKQAEPTPGGPAGQLYHLADDPRQEKNLWREKPDEVARLTAMLERTKAAGRSR